MLLFQLLLALLMMAKSDCHAPKQLADETAARHLASPEPPKKLREQELTPIVELPKLLKECSGMVELGNGLLVGHNDSGNRPELYVFDVKDPSKVRTVLVANVNNNDWEELAYDDQYVYIGDTGNNGGTRRNLMVYKIKKSELRTATTVTPEVIKFSYKDQTKFNDSNKHNFDCEAFVCAGDSLYLFSKNRGDFHTNIYGFPKVAGEYVVEPLGTYNAGGLVTGADFRKKGNKSELVLVGYSVRPKKLFYPFVIHFTDFEGHHFFEGQVQRWDHDQILQTESIVFHKDNEVWITNEEEDGTEGMLYSLKLK